MFNTLSAQETAFFLDFDGTLVDLAQTPDEVRVNTRTRSILTKLIHASNGAVAVVSGRSMDRLDALLAPLKLPLAGVHGAERRSARGAIFRMTVDKALLRQMQQTLEGTVRAHPGMLLEYKNTALAVHFRNVRGDPEKIERATVQVIERLVAQASDQYSVQYGKRVVEIKPKHVDKGKAIEAFLSEPPFIGRIPFFVGDDRTDETGFAAVNARGGWSVKIGAGATAARVRLRSTGALLEWLERLCFMQNENVESKNTI